MPSKPPDARHVNAIVANREDLFPKAWLHDSYRLAPARPPTVAADANTTPAFAG